MRLEKPTGAALTYRTSKSYRIKWEALADKDVRKTFGNSADLFRRDPEMHSGGGGGAPCTKQLKLHLLLEYVDTNDSVW